MRGLLFTRLPFAVLVVLFGSEQAIARDLYLPCANSERSKTRPYLRKCNEIIGSIGGEGALNDIRNRVDRYVRNVYQAENEEKARELRTQGNEALSVPFTYGRVCNLDATRVNREPNVADGPAASCGAPLGLKVTPSFGNASCTDFDCMSRNTQVELSFEYSRADGTILGTAEAAYLRGGWISAIECYSTKILNEIESQKRISNISSECSSVAMELMVTGSDGVARKQRKSIIQMYDLHLNKLEEYSLNNRQHGDILKCEGTAYLNQESKNADGKVVDGDLRQAAQKMCATRYSLEAVFKQMAYCEILSRAEEGYRAALPAGDRGFLEEVAMKLEDGSMRAECQELGHSTSGEDTAMKTCATRAFTQPRCSTYKHEGEDLGLFSSCTVQVKPDEYLDCIRASGAMGESYNSCYQRWYPTFIKNKFERFSRPSCN